ncbi:hypothetical protein ACLM5J_18555 [Nocardioides sp. Bht2]|uniref:hypothetical protein n=1 Tax=Nocardioides sp. Bht2 TaxID=3392297 RepID=UPI0039B403D3
MRAIKTGNESTFLAGLAADPALRGSERDYFDNLQDLPLARFGYRLDTASVQEQQADDGSYRVQAELTVVTQLDGFDDRPVRAPARFVFERADDGTLLLTSTHDAAWEADHGVTRQPWETERVEVINSDQVLGIFDKPSAAHGWQIVDDVADALAAIRPELPVEWDSGVVVYGLSTTEFLSSLADLPGGVPDRLDGVAFPVPISPGSQTYASTRFLLHPRMVGRRDDARRRLIRHELVHVGLGRLDDRIPTWLSEGIAEYLAARPIAPQDRLISRDAVNAAQRGITELPSDQEFNGDDSSANYGIAWFACDYIADTYGESTLWKLFNVMRAGNGTASADQDEVLRDVLGVGEADLARATGDRITSVFG